MTSAILYVISHGFKYGLADRWYPKESEVWIYFLSGHFAEEIERDLTMMPNHIIISKLIPNGIESTMMAFSSTIIKLNAHVIRNLLGVFINDNFVGVTNKTLTRYKYLCLISFVLSIFPLIIIKILMPSNKEIDEK